MLPNDPLKVPLARQPLQSTAVGLGMIEVTQA
jgi:hypothetical protein